MTTQATEPSEARRVLERWYEVLIAKDGPALDALMSDDIQVGIIGSTPMSGHFFGKAAVQENSAKLHTRLADDFRHGEYWRVVCEQDNVAVVLAEARGEAEHDRYDQTYCMIFWVREGKVVKILEFIDTVVLEAALYGNQLTNRQTPPDIRMDVTEATDPR